MTGLRGRGLAVLLWCAAALVASPAQAVTVPGNYPTIQAAINAVTTGSLPDGTVIDVQPGTYAEALLINTTPRSMTIRGSGPTTTVVNATGRGVSALRIYNATGTIRIEGLTITGGLGGPGTGGGFTFNDSSPLITNVVFENNSSVQDGGGGVLTRSNAQFAFCEIRGNTTARFGGGVVITTGSRPTFTNCQIRLNQSGTGGPGMGNIGSGGGVHTNDASPTFRGCTITNNSSKFAAGGIFHMGIWNSPYGPATMLLEDSDVSNNATSRYSNADNPAEGGGIHIEDYAVAHLLRTRVTNNSANTAGGLGSYRARFEISSSIIEGNHAPDPLGIGGFGGGITINSNNLSLPFRQAGSLVLIDSVVRNNDARVGGGILASGDQVCGFAACGASAVRASLEITDSLIEGNTASLSAAGMRLDRLDGTMTNSHVLRNSVAASGQSYGGGLLLASGAQMTVAGSTIARNAAVNFGGGLFVDDSAVLQMTGSRVYGNTAASGGGLYVGNIGPPSGTIQSSTIADNGAYQIHEQACGALVRTILSYQNNTITPAAGSSDLYFSTCGGATSSISSFNALPGGRASGNTSAAPSFKTFLATPDIGPTVLSWSVSRASSVTVPGVTTVSGDTGSTTVAPTAPTTYSLTNVGGPGTAASANVTVARSWGATSDTPIRGDFDGDGRNDLAVYRESTGQWFILRSTAGFLAANWGAPALGDIPVAADYDGDGRTDIAVFRQASGQWFIARSTGGSATLAWGAPILGDTPVPADYDGDNRADIAVYRRSTGGWYIQLATGASRILGWGAPSLGDTPVPADYDGDGRADIGVFRTSTGQWLIAQSALGTLIAGWGAPSLGDVPVPADYDGDGRADIAVARQTTGDWFIRGASGAPTIRKWGFGDARVPGDFNGDGRDEITIFRAATGSWLSAP